MKVLADEGVDRLIVERLRQEGHAVSWVAEMAPGISDESVLDAAKKESALLITADKDFGELVFRKRMVSSGVMLIRLAGLPSFQKADLVASALLLHGESMYGAFSVITSKAVRIRQEPA